MPWQERMGPATFRGVPFFVDVASLSGGRNTVVFQYPGRDVPFVEDLGRRARTFSITGYVIGPEYLTARDALVAALEDVGPGRLVHPYYGTKLVSVGEFQVQERREEGGMAIFLIPFHETESQPFAPGVVVAPSEAASRSSLSALGAITGRYTSLYTVTMPGTSRSLPSFSFSSIATIVQSSVVALNRFLAPVVKGTQDLANLKRTLDRLALDALSLVRTPVALATRFGEVLQSLLRLPVTPRLGIDALVRAYDFTTDEPPEPLTVIRATELSNYNATKALIQSSIAVQACQLVVETARSGGFTSYDDAVLIRDVVFGMLDEQVAAADDTVFGALAQLRADVALAVPGEARDLPRLVAHTPPITLPSLVIAYQLYGGLTLNDDLIARNRVRHPGFVIGGRALQVLSHV